MKFRIFTLGLLLLALFWLSGLTSGDTIYLKSGKKIQTSWVEVKGDKVQFLKYGGIVTIPADQVERIVSDLYAEEGIDHTASDEEYAAQPVPLPPAPEEGEEEILQEEALKRTAKYWIERREFLNQQLIAKEEELQQLRINVLGTLTTGFSTIPLAEKILLLEEEIDLIKQELANLEFEAKRYGIKPGELRRTPPPR